MVWEIGKEVGISGASSTSADEHQHQRPHGLDPVLGDLTAVLRAGLGLGVGVELDAPYSYAVTVQQRAGKALVPTSTPPLSPTVIVSLPAHSAHSSPPARTLFFPIIPLSSTSSSPTAPSAHALPPHFHSHAHLHASPFTSGTASPFYHDPHLEQRDECADVRATLLLLRRPIRWAVLRARGLTSGPFSFLVEAVAQTGVGVRSIARGGMSLCSKRAGREPRAMIASEKVGRGVLGGVLGGKGWLLVVCIFVLIFVGLVPA
ncbi:hypothetical protein DFH08DRAFT_979366 [Mycena albidolilacea]|uniref:Uncharacterized protein n=1 Tax=Mycena albidolilacea TaxID=1033008 RepID=A0AAD7E6J3_9AGAR|nr:hypothetical protein DFH08DRAFT_979366 [Mycena albidolilacea]